MIRKLWYVYTMEYYSAIKKNPFESVLMSWTDCLMNYGWRFVTLYRGQESRPSPRKRNAKKQNGCLRRPYIAEKRSERQRRKGKIYPVECRVPKNSKER